MKIFKYPLDLKIGDVHNIDMPAGAIILSIQTQYLVPCIWAMCDETQPIARRRIVLYGTGQVLPTNPGKYIGTMQFDGGHFVFHFFDAS
jgi:hypothetical protein